MDNNPSKILVSAKRKRNERSGVHAWHPYYAGYAESFVDSAIDYLDLNGDSLVLDPWTGSGTTQLVCAKRGIRAIGFDVNPVMINFTNAKTGPVLSSHESLKKLSIALKERLEGKRLRAANEDPLLEWMSNSLCGAMREIYKTISDIDFSKMEATSLFNCVSEQPENSPLDCHRSFFTAALFVLGRELAKYAAGSNPTWTKATESHLEYSSYEVIESFLTQCEKMLREVKSLGIAPHTTNIALTGDSRSLPIRESSIDGIITSPPYLTRIDYAISTRPELLLLGDADHLRRTRELTMGAPVIVDKNVRPQPSWGQSANLLVEIVSNHKTKAAKSYYLPNILQYFRDADMSLNEIIRVLKPGARALIVVQSSYFKEAEINLGEMYVEMANQRGCKSGIANRDVVRGHMAHVNTKSSEYKSEKVYYEDVVEVQKPKR